MKPALEILEDGKLNGVSQACRKYGISRTLYYRWQQRYLSRGLEGVQPVRRQQLSTKLLDPTIEQEVLKMIRQYPLYGPLSIAYLLKEQKITISHGGVYNVMKRHQLNTREQRLKLSKRSIIAEQLPHDPLPGQLWLAWTTQIMPNIYIYHLYDISSGIACSRLYANQSSANSLDLLKNVALPISETVEMPVKWIVYQPTTDYASATKRHPYLAFLRSHQIIALEWDHRFAKYQPHTEHFHRQCHQYLIQHGNLQDLTALKITLQDFLRNYNIHQPNTLVGNGQQSPLSIMTGKPVNEITLPLWAHIYRNY